MSKIRGTYNSSNYHEFCKPYLKVEAPSSNVVFSVY